MLTVVGSRPFPMILSPLMRLFLFDHAPTRFAENGSRGHDVNAIDLG